MKKKLDVRKMVVTAMLAAVSTVLMFFSFNVPLMPSFIKLDFSELPALLAAFALGPVSGVAVCLIKNLVNVMFSTTGGVGELSNFILGTLFVLPAGLLYRYRKTAGGALMGSLLGALIMAGVSVVTNYFVVYPIYTAFMPMEAILGMYQAINHNVSSLWDALLWFNMPFTFIKGLCSVAMCFAIYKPLSPILKGASRKTGKEKAAQA
ncbi:MAG: ECF transporter S component [Oscillospiraceae bacterium]|nr:ECF transporter S component [Oscillospiraceae bacterium]